MIHKTWLLDGLIHSAPGVITLNGNRLSFVLVGPGTFGERHLTKYFSSASAYEELLSQNMTLFDVEVSEIKKAKFPWYSFGAGCNLEINEVQYKLSFVEPQNTKFPTNRLDSIGGDLAEGANFGKILKSKIQEKK